MSNLRTQQPNTHADERGVALLLVLTSLTLLTITVVDFQEEQMTDLQSSIADRDALQAEYMAKSAMNLSRLLIANEPTLRQTLQQSVFGFFFRSGVPQLPLWEFSNTLLGLFNDQEGQKSFSQLGNFEFGSTRNLNIPEGTRFSIEVVDEDSKINLNLGARNNDIARNRFASAFLGLTMGANYDPLFERNDRDGNLSSRVAICGALIDWADSDDRLFACDPRNFQASGSTGVEDQSYALLPKPYRIKNAAYDSLEEARLVRGMGDDFWSTFVDPDPTRPKKRVMTVWGQGPINVNTATPQAVLAVVCGNAPVDTPICIDVAKQAQFLTMFGVLRSFTSGVPLFGNPNEFVQTVQGQGNYGKLLFEQLGIPPVRFQSPAEAAKSFVTESKVFSIYGVGEVRGYQRTTQVRIHSVVDFRRAPTLPTQALFTNNPNSTIPSTTPSAIPGLPSGLSAEAIAGALLANPGGSIVYYRVE